jgi:hypothetical protein
MNIGDDVLILAGKNLGGCLNKSQREQAQMLRPACNLQNVRPLATGFLLLAFG